MSGRQHQRRREMIERAYLDGLRDVMSTAKGRAAIWGILEKTGMHGEMMTGNSHTFYNVGKRDVGVSLLGDLYSECLAEYRIMEDEAHTRARRVALEEQAAQGSPENDIYSGDTTDG